MVLLQTPGKGLPYALVFAFRGKEDFPTGGVKFLL
jgi:hypothetical protein